MNVIDVTPRPAAVTAVVRFLQNRSCRFWAFFHTERIEMGNAALRRAAI